MLPLKKNKIINKLGDSIFSRNFIIFENIGSTNNYAIEMAENGAPEGTIVIAEEQSEGRGRMGRVWVSPKYANLLMSVVLRPKVELRGVFTFTMIMALSVTDAIFDIFELKAGIKWPNDIYYNGKKLGGILTEISAKGHEVEYAVVGLGLNVNWKPEGMMEMRYPAVCISDVVGSVIPRDNIVCSILSKLDSYCNMVSMGQLDSLYELWGERSVIMGKMVEIDTGKDIVSGKVIHFDHFGTVILEDREGKEQKVLYGDVSLKEIKQ